MKKKKYNIIPLGQNCMPRTILTRWGLKKRKLFGEKTFPFDLAVFGMPEVTKTLRTDFEEFFNDLEYKDDCWIKAPNCIYFSHDKRYNQNNKKELVEQYQKRIENFRECVIKDDFVVFLQILGDDEDVINTYKALKQVRHGQLFLYIVVDTENIVPDIHYDGLSILKLNYPTKDYKNNWWKEEVYSSNEGQQFEKQIIDFCKKEIEEY